MRLKADKGKIRLKKHIDFGELKLVLLKSFKKMIGYSL